MPELPEVEVVRRGLERWVAGRVVDEVEVRHPRAIRRHLPGPLDFAGRLRGATLHRPARRGKYLWIPVSTGGADFAVIAHLGMSGQMLVVDRDTEPERHLRIRFRFADGGRDLRFIDQRTFGGLFLDDVDDEGLPGMLSHIARDPLDPRFDDAAWAAAVRRKRTGIKRALLDQTLVSGIGNIYADESLWRAKLHGERPTSALTRPTLQRLLAHVREVLAAALEQGGTSFDSLYVNVNGESGYFDRSLNAYG
ncbi:MAG: mutM1, partial [Pseudonocardiales bacterium]|nr:mutM1 [Pseudonocardiales bacterium]